jgi:hypothetical protein
MATGEQTPNRVTGRNMIANAAEADIVDLIERET